MCSKSWLSSVLCKGLVYVLAISEHLPDLTSSKTLKVTENKREQVGLYQLQRTYRTTEITKTARCYKLLGEKKKSAIPLIGNFAQVQGKQIHDKI